MLFRPSPHLKEEPPIPPNLPTPYLQPWLGEQGGVLLVRPISSDVGTRLQLFLMDGSEKPFFLYET